MYIDSGTFWVIAIALGVAIGVVYYLLDKRVDANTKKTAQVCEVIHQMAEMIDTDLADIRNEAHRDKAEIYGHLADAFEEVEKAYEESPKQKPHQKAH